MIWMLLVVYQLKHFLADYPLQTPYMLQKFKPTLKEYFAPLAAHAGTHALMTLVIACTINAKLWWLAVLDFTIHFVVDRIKASPKMLGKYKALSASEFGALTRSAVYPGNNQELILFKNNCIEKLKHNKYFWWALGADQMAHHLTHYFIIYCLVTNG